VKQNVLHVNLSTVFRGAFVPEFVRCDASAVITVVQTNVHLFILLQFQQTLVDFYNI